MGRGAARRRASRQVRGGGERSRSRSALPGLPLARRRSRWRWSPRLESFRGGPGGGLRVRGWGETRGCDESRGQGARCWLRDWSARLRAAVPGKVRGAGDRAAPHPLSSSPQTVVEGATGKTLAREVAPKNIRKNKKNGQSGFT